MKKILPILFFAGLLVYSNSFHASFHLDDHASIVVNDAIKNLPDWRPIFDFWPTRFITYFTFALNYHLHGLDVFGYHLINWLFHLGAALCVAWLALLILPEGGKRKTAVSVAALIFLVHPIQTEAVTYIVQRATVLAAFFSLLSLCLYAEGRRRQGKVSIFYFIGCCMTTAAAMFSKENAIVLPFLIGLYEFFFRIEEPGLSRWKRLTPIFLCLSIIPVTLGAMHSINLEHGGRVQEAPVAIPPFYYFLTQLRVIVTYFRLIVLPIGQNLDYDYRIITSVWQPQFFLSAIFLGALLWSGVALYRRHRLLSCSIFWFFITLLPESSFFAFNDVIFEHRLYLPLAAFAFFWASLVQKRVWIVWVLIVMLPGYGILTFERNGVWKDELSLWNDVIAKSPEKARGFNNRGNVYQLMGKGEEALKDLNKAIQLQPNYVEAYYNRGYFYQERRDWPKAISDYSQALKIYPAYAEALNNRGLIYQGQGELELALKDYEDAIRLRGRYAEAYYNRGNLYLGQAKLENAIHDFSEAIRIRPSYAEAFNNRGNAYQDQGDINLAFENYNKAIQINPKFVEAYNNRSSVYAAKGQLELALKDLDYVLKLNPQYSQAEDNRALLLQQLSFRSKSSSSPK